MQALVVARGQWRRLRDVTAGYLGNADPLAAASNSGAFLVWSSQPLYPVYVAAIVGRDAWPSLLTWLSTPVFFAVPLVARASSKGGRATFVIAGVANTLLSTKAFGPDTAVGWFLVPCLVIALGFFRSSEWRFAAVLCAMTIAAALIVTRLGPPLHAYRPAQATSLAHLNLWSVVVLSVYLVVAAVRARRTVA